MDYVTKSNACFFEGMFVRSAYTDDSWRDISDNTYFIFESAFGIIKLRKRHNYPQTFAFTKGSRLHIGYGDPEAGELITRTKLGDIPEEVFYDQELLYIVADCKKQTVTIQRDAYSTLPLFMSRQENQLVLSNHYEVVWQMAKRHKLHVNMQVVTSLFVYDPTWGSPLFKEIESLFDRARLVWIDGTYNIITAPTGKHAELINERHGDPHDFRQLLETNLNNTWARYGQHTKAGAELSGGIDSTLICGYFASKRYPFLPVTVEYGGDFTNSLKHKLGVFKHHFGVASKLLGIDGSSDYPLAANYLHGQWRPFYYDTNMYERHGEKMADYLEAQGVGVVFRGLAGDELCENNPDLLESPRVRLQKQFDDMFPKIPWLRPESRKQFEASIYDLPQTPAISLASPNTRTGPLDHANTYIDRNIWPVEPFNNPRLYLYTQSLPARYRWHKTLLRAYMHAANFPKDLYEPEINEHFTHFFDEGFAQYMTEPFMLLMQHSVLAQKGLVDAKVATEEWNKTLYGQRKNISSTKGFYDFYYLLVMEANLQLAPKEQLVIQ